MTRFAVKGEEDKTKIVEFYLKSDEEGDINLYAVYNGESTKILWIDVSDSEIVRDGVKTVDGKWYLPEELR